jgi:hypothetical protein
MLDKHLVFIAEKKKLALEVTELQPRVFSFWFILCDQAEKLTYGIFRLCYFL